ncbi:MAG: ribosome maturation factor RimM [Propionibacteriaceae bacterium]|nr:ribosome maturation factor RimM [Propionibacteriaceae bacterium]
MSAIEVMVGRIGRAHGLRGEVFVDLHTDSPELRFRPGAVLSIGESSLTVASLRSANGRVVVRFEEVADRTSAEQLTGSELFAWVDEQESPVDDNEFFDHQLVGLDVFTAGGEHAGSILRVDHLGFQDMLVVGMKDTERLVPFVQALVPTVDLGARRVVVNDIPGLLEEIE